MTISVAEQMPAWYFSHYHKPLEKRLVDIAHSWARKALRLTRRSAECEFTGRGYEILYRELSFGGVRMRARLSLRSKELFIDPGSEADLFQDLDSLGFPLYPTPKSLILTHELFHLFCPRCPEPVAELAAHLYCVEALGLDYFPGILDMAGQLSASQTVQRRTA